MRSPAERPIVKTYRTVRNVAMAATVQMVIPITTTTVLRVIRMLPRDCRPPCLAARRSRRPSLCCRRVPYGEPVGCRSRGAGRGAPNQLPHLSMYEVDLVVCGALAYRERHFPIGLQREHRTLRECIAAVSDSVPSVLVEIAVAHPVYRDGSLRLQPVQVDVNVGRLPSGVGENCPLRTGLDFPGLCHKQQHGRLDTCPERYVVHPLAFVSSVLALLQKRHDKQQRPYQQHPALCVPEKQQLGHSGSREDRRRRRKDGPHSDTVCEVTSTLDGSVGNRLTITW